MQTLILAGISGDLATRKLLPALRSLADDGTLPFDRIIGTSRRAVEIDRGNLGEKLELRQLDIGNVEDIATLAQDIEGEIVVYLSLPPGTVVQAARALQEGGLGRARLLLEKPFGFDTESATEESAQVARYFKEEQLYRVDHFLFKSLVRDIRSKAAHANHLEIFASEDSVVGHRAAFYDSTGALRDFGNHLLSIAAVTLGGRHTLPEVTFVRASRAQYEGYGEEVGTSTSDTETFFSLELKLHDTTILLASGKGLATKETSICIDGECWFDTPDGAYESVLTAAAKGEHEKFLSLTEVLGVWRIMDQARRQWGRLDTYKRGAKIESLIK